MLDNGKNWDDYPFHRQKIDYKLDSEILNHVLNNPKRSNFILDNIRMKGKECFREIKDRQTGRTNREVLEICYELSYDYNVNDKSLIIVLTSSEKESNDLMCKIYDVCSVLYMKEVLGTQFHKTRTNKLLIIPVHNFDECSVKGIQCKIKYTHFALETLNKGDKNGRE